MLNVRAEVWIRAISKVLNDYQYLKGHNDLQKVKVVFLLFFGKDKLSTTF